MNWDKKRSADIVILCVCLAVLVSFNLRKSRDGNPEGFRVIVSTTPAMIEEIAYAEKNREWIVASTWRPHWMNARLKLKYLDDPKKIFGGEEDICTVARKGFSGDHPQVAKFLRQFRWAPEHLDSLTLKSVDRKGEYEANAREWIRENPALVESFLKDVRPEPGARIRLVNTGYLNELTANHMIKVLLEDRLKCTVSMVSTTNPIAFESLASGSQDVMLTVWLPTYHRTEYGAVRDKVELIGANLHGTRMGLSVPSYVPVDSIPELKRYRDRFKGRIIGIEPGQAATNLAVKAVKEYGL